MPASADFSGLSAEERQILTAWRLAAVERDLDAVIDLTGRDWKLPDTQAILGIFQRGQDKATWLLVRDRMGWSVLDCTSNTVMGGTLAFDDALALIIS